MPETMKELKKIEEESTGYFGKGEYIILPDDNEEVKEFLKKSRKLRGQKLSDFLEEQEKTGVIKFGYKLYVNGPWISKEEYIKSFN